VKTNLATTDTTFAFNNGWGTNRGLRLRVSGMTYASLSKLGTVLGKKTGSWECPVPAAVHGDTAQQSETVDADAVWIEGTGHLGTWPTL
jgi:hypothetical protein